MIEALKQLVDALENHSAIKHPQQIHYRDAAIEAGKQAIKELESQKPVACPYCHNSATLGAVYFDQNCVECVKRMSHSPKRTWVGLMRGVRVEGDTVVISVHYGNDAARQVCGALIEEMNT